MFTKQDTDQDSWHSVPIGDSQEKETKNPFKKFDKETRDNVIVSCQYVAFLLAAGTCIASFTIPALRKSRPRGIAMWQWSLLATVLLVGPLMSKAIVRLVLFFKDKEFSARENILCYVAELVESAWVVVWFSMILITWLIVVDEPDYLNLPLDKTEKIIKKFDATYPVISITLVTFILGSFLWLLKNLVLIRAKSSFHIKTFFDRIKEALKHQSVVEALSTDTNINIDDHSKKSQCFVKIQVITSYLDRRKNSFDVSKFEGVTPEDVSYWGMKKVIYWIKGNPYLTYNEITIDSEEKAVDVVNRIFSSFHRDDGRPLGDNSGDQITWDDIVAFERKKLDDIAAFERKKLSEEVKKCLFEGDDDHIDKESFKKWMVKVYKYRSALVSALKANKRLFRTFSIFINIVLVLFIFALWLIMVRVETRRIIFVTATAIVGAAVIFGDVCKKIIDNLLFLFVVHPYDIGDYCLIDDTPVKIQKINVLTTVALTLDDEIRHYPNSVLSGKTISNYTRRLDMGDVIEFTIDRKTSMKNINMLKNRVESYICDHPRIWKPKPRWVTVFVDDTKMKMKLHFRHKVNHDDFSERENRKSELVFKIKEILDECSIG